MLVEFFTTETGRAGLRATIDGIGKREYLRKRVTVGERKAFFERMQAVQNRIDEATRESDEDKALEASIDMLGEILEGVDAAEVERFDIYDLKEFAEASRKLMENGGKEAKKNE